MHVQEARKRIGSRIEWLCDTMDNRLKHALGDRPNSEFVVDPDGLIIRHRTWSDPDRLREDLGELVGAVEDPTRVEDLGSDFGFKPPSPSVPTGLVPRRLLSGRTVALRIEPLPGDRNHPPYYAKLRAEADPELVRTGTGKLYLGFHLDPLYQVHWNNLAEPLRYSVVPSKAEPFRASPMQGSAPRVPHPADKDPREFILEVREASVSEPFEVAVEYFACDDANTFCVPVHQKYRVSWERDPDAGNPRRPGQARFGNRAGTNRPPLRTAGPGGFSPIFRMLDRDRSGILEEPEILGASARLRESDRDGDGQVTLRELFQNARNGGRRSDGSDGSGNRPAND